MGAALRMTPFLIRSTSSATAVAALSCIPPTCLHMRTSGPSLPALPRQHLCMHSRAAPLARPPAMVRFMTAEPFKLRHAAMVTRSVFPLKPAIGLSWFIGLQLD